MTSDIVLAVLPFKTLEKERSTIVQNFEEDLVYHLSKFQGLSVLSYFSTSHWSLNDEELLKKYRVSHTVTGFFRWANDRMVMNVQLLEVPQNRVIYDQRVEYDEQKIFELLDQTVLQVTNLLRSQLDQSILSKSYRKPEVDLSAYELLLMGNACLKNKTPEDDSKARAFFEEALKKQPLYARAYAGISSSYFNQWSCQLWDRWEISQNGAKKYALKAIDIDENDYQSLCILGRVLLFEREFDQAEFYMRKSLEMNNNDAGTLLEIAFSFMFLGFVEEAVELYERACSLNPLKEDKYLSVGASMVFEKGDFERALELGKPLEVSNTYIDFPIYMAASAHYLGDEETAARYWELYLEKFERHIYFHDKGKTQNALSWHINVNPYRRGTRLEEFREYIRKTGRFELHNSGTETAKPHGLWQMDNHQVTLTYAGKTCVLNKTKGLADIAVLLEKPFQDLHCMELMKVEQVGNEGVAVVDSQSKKAYQDRLMALQSDIEEAEQMGHLMELEKLNKEYDQLVSHLSKSLGLKGESRKSGSAAEKARAAVTLRIRDSIKKISAQNEALGAHLSNSIKTGLLCAYRPEVAVDWEVSGV